MPTVHSRRPARSFLYVPGDRRDRLAKAPARGADALIVDLEDSVATSAKAAAREGAAGWLAEQTDRQCQVWVRVNVDSWADDLDAILGVKPNGSAMMDPIAAVDGIVLPKAEPGLVRAVDRRLAELERRRSPGSRIALIALVETAKGLLSTGELAAELAAAARVCRLGIGEADLLAELRIRPTEGREELTSLRLQIVVASAAAGIAAPIAPTSTDVRDLTALRHSTQTLLRLGFRARTAIHPAQVPIINEVFTPAAKELERARRIVADFEAAQRGGSGVWVDQDGRMVDVAVVRSAREVIDLADPS